MGAGEVGRAWDQGEALGGLPGVRPLWGTGGALSGAKHAGKGMSSRTCLSCDFLGAGVGGSVGRPRLPLSPLPRKSELRCPTHLPLVIFTPAL